MSRLVKAEPEKKAFRSSNNPRLEWTVVSECGVSDREFYDVFDSLDECVVAAFDEALARVSRLVIEAAECEQSWRERVHAALSALLVFFDMEPRWARFLVGESPVATNAVFERRQKGLAALARALMTWTVAEANSDGWFVPSSELAAELVVGGVFCVLRTRVLDASPEPYVLLVPSLMEFITASFEPPDPGVSGGLDQGVDTRSSRCQRLPVRTTYRTSRVLSAIGASPGMNNREIAEAAGLSDEGQTSKLLRRLEQRGLVQNFGLGQPAGGANAWRLTPYGDRVRDATRHSLVPGTGAVKGRRVRGAA